MSLEEMVTSLCHVHSFNGHLGLYTTAQHSCLVCDLLGGSYYGLMHDIHEAITGDAATPVKNAINLLGNGAWTTFEESIAKTVRHNWGVTHPLPVKVKKADHTARLIEIASLATNTAKAEFYKLGYEPLNSKEWMIREVWSADRAYEEFMVRFDLYGPTGRRGS